MAPLSHATASGSLGAMSVSRTKVRSTTEGTWICGLGPLRDALRAHRTAQLAERMAAGSQWQDNGLVFFQ